MAMALPRILERIVYEEAERTYQRGLPLEHYMESIAQSTQRKITVAAFDLVHVARPEVQGFSELLVQYPENRRTCRPIRQVVPDNMVVIHEQPIVADGSYNIPFQPVGPFWTLEYTAAGNERKDYDDSFLKYERYLKVPYYLIFSPHAQELTLFRHNRRRYVTVKPNQRGRLAIPQLEIEMGLVEGWVRYWFRGRLLPLTSELQVELNEAQRQLAVTQTQLTTTQTQLTTTQTQLEGERLARQAVERQLAEALAQLAQVRGSNSTQP